MTIIEIKWLVVIKLGWDIDDNKKGTRLFKKKSNGANNKRIKNKENHLPLYVPKRNTRIVLTVNENKMQMVERTGQFLLQPIVGQGWT